MRRRRTAAALAACLALVIGLVVNAPPAGAQTFHGYATANHSGLAGGYYGVATTRSENIPITGLPTTWPACVDRYSSSPIYTPNWMAMYNGVIEMGTGHQCNDNYRYWFWGFYANGGPWTEINHQTIYGVTTHTFWINQSVGSNWHDYNIDGTTMGSINWFNVPNAAYDGTVGVESWCGGCTIPVVVMYNTRVKAQDSNWYQMNWPSITVGPSPMDGTWYSPDQLNACENNSC